MTGSEMTGAEYQLGLGHAKITVDIRRLDGTVSRVEIYDVFLSDSEDGTVSVTEENPYDILAGRYASSPSEKFVSLMISGRMLPSEDGDLLRMEAKVDE